MRLDDNLILQIRSLQGWKYRFASPESRWGKQQLRNYRFLLESQWWSLDELQQYQWARIKSLLNHAYDNTRFYRRLYDSVKIHPDDIRSFADFQRLPLVTKSDVRNHLEDMKSSNFAELQPVETRTGGSTGSPLFMYKSLNAEQMRVAVAFRSRKYAELEYDARRASIDTTPYSGRLPWHADFKINNLVYYCLLTNDESMERFLKLAKSLKVQALACQVGFGRLLIRHIEQNYSTGWRPRAVFSVGEAITPEYREDVRNQLGCTVYDSYGMRENAVSASECEAGSLHINSEFTYIEFDNDGTPASPNQRAEIIGTNLHNFAVPLIRYATEDLGCAEEMSCPCGRKLPIMRIEGGRSRDFIVTKSGCIFINWHLAQLIDKTMGVDKMQLYQPDKANLVVRIVSRGNFQRSDEEKILVKLRELTRGELNLAVEYCEDIPRTPLGKFRFVVSELYEETFQPKRTLSDC